MSVKVDFDQALLTSFGEPELTGDKFPLRLGFICSYALGRTWQGDKRDDKEKDNDWKLALKIGKSGKDIERKNGEIRFGLLDLTNKEASHVADVVRAVYPGPCYGAQCAMMLEGESEEKAGE